MSKNKVIKELVNRKWEYRTLSGENNNKKHTHYGEKNQPYVRISGHVDNIRGRPNPRDVSNALCNQTHDTHEGNVSNFFWLWGQFIDHTFTLVEEGTRHDDIRTPKDDPYFQGKSISFIKSPHAPNQINTMPAYLDATNVYGHDEDRLKYLRTGYHGLLKECAGGLPPVNDGSVFMAGLSNKMSFACGDVRANEQLSLTAIHCLFIREHNYWARSIREYNRKLCDEEIFQLAKIMVEAEIQAITFNEFLPILLGKKCSIKNKYTEDVNVQISQEFATCAYRFGHSMVSGKFPRLKANGKSIPEGDVDLRQAFFSPHRLCNEGGVEPIFRGFAKSKAQKLDNHIIDDLRNFLFGRPGAGGLDLAAINIQRGRDHNIPDYNTVRYYLGLERIDDIREITDNEEVIEGVEKVYNRELDNCDLWIMGLIEKRYKDALVGNTFYYILKNQFKKFKQCDRFWYERRLSSSMVEYINSVRLSDIIKRCTDIGDKEIQDNVFRVKE